ncbi:MAG: F0F1 ATP synthase subunit delta [Candidatus Omnitrophica bacterium]|nr:F0F1 ATP synthase subunit delta [Candidatus Omnitrophota bacterium]
MIEIIVVQILAFAGLVALLRWLFVRNVTSAMERLELLHQENLKRENELQNRLQAVEQEHKTKIQRSEEEAKEILSLAKARAEEAREQLLKEAKGESQRIIQEAHERREELRRELEEQVEQKAVQLASDAVRYVLTTKLEQEVHRQLVDELIADVGTLDASLLDVNAAKAQVVSSQKLEPEQRHRLEGILSQKAGRAIQIVESVDQKVIAGIVIRLDSLILDGSLLNKLREAVGYVRKSSA